MFVPSNVSIMDNLGNHTLSFSWPSPNEEYNNTIELTFPFEEKNSSGSLELSLFEGKIEINIYACVGLRNIL